MDGGVNMLDVLASIVSQCQTGVLTGGVRITQVTTTPLYANIATRIHGSRMEMGGGTTTSIGVNPAPSGGMR